MADLPWPLGPVVIAKARASPQGVVVTGAQWWDAAIAAGLVLSSIESWVLRRRRRALEARLRRIASYVVVRHGPDGRPATTWSLDSLPGIVGARYIALDGFIVMRLGAPRSGSREATCPNWRSSVVIDAREASDHGHDDDPGWLP